MREDDLKELQCMEDILEKDLRAELKKVKDNGSFAPGQTKTLLDAIELMLKSKEYEEWLHGEGMSETSRRQYARSYADSNYRNTNMGSYGYNRPNAYGMNPYDYPRSNAYDYGYSGHSTKDRMIARLEDMMGEAKNEYEATMIRDAIANIQNSK